MKEEIKQLFKRFNQIVLSFPIWIVLGLSGIFHSRRGNGWKKSEKNEEFGKMY